MHEPCDPTTLVHSDRALSEAQTRSRRTAQAREAGMARALARWEGGGSEGRGRRRDRGRGISAPARTPPCR